MIRLTRLRQNDPLYINPDHIERLEGHHDTVVHLLNGTEYVVVESPEEIVEQVIYLRARAIGLAARLAVDGIEASSAGTSAASAVAVDPVHAAAVVSPLPTVHRDGEPVQQLTRDQKEG
ncbi:MAG: flagellar FlbD family protein [Actinobacteria bacterium]|nr:flagellar FlbD family protein [Actinomycetota bacterium]